MSESGTDMSEKTTVRRFGNAGVRNQPRVILITLSALLSFPGLLLTVSCGGAKRTPPPVSASGVHPSPTTPVPDKAPVKPRVAPLPRKIKEAPPVRVLIRQDFESVRLEGSDLAPVVIITHVKGSIELKDSGGKVVGSGSGFRLRASGPAPLRLDGRPYRGAVDAFINPLRNPVIVNDVSLEDYLKGVVPNELSPTVFPVPEAIKAQAVAARTFAISSLSRNAARGFDLFADERSQVYRGFDTEQRLSSQTVDRTRGIIATYDNQPITAFYSSTCGGLTSDYAVIFQRSQIPYLKGGVQCPDEASPYRYWDETISVARIQKNLDRLADLGRLRKLSVLRRSGAGHIVEMRFVGERGEKVLKGLRVRSALGVKSNWITSLDPRYDESGFISVVRAKGRGFGHGVGMCQIGAVELGRRGWDFKRILKHYYQGIELQQHW